jgi:hypothetical protein
VLREGIYTLWEDLGVPHVDGLSHFQENDPLAAEVGYRRTGLIAYALRVLLLRLK